MSPPVIQWLRTQLVLVELQLDAPWIIHLRNYSLCKKNLLTTSLTLIASYSHSVFFALQSDNLSDIKEFLGVCSAIPVLLIDLKNSSWRQYICTPWSAWQSLPVDPVGLSNPEADQLLT